MIKGLNYKKSIKILPTQFPSSDAIKFLQFGTSFRQNLTELAFNENYYLIPHNL